MDGTVRVLLAFVDPKDPYLLTEIEEEERAGPVLSILGARAFDLVLLFHTPHTAENAGATAAAASARHPGVAITVRELAVSDPKDYSSLMGLLAREMRALRDVLAESDNYICVSSGTAEMRAAWFLLQASGLLPAKLLQVGSPADPLFGPANVTEVDFDGGDWGSLRDLLMPQAYFSRQAGMARIRSRSEAVESWVEEIDSNAKFDMALSAPVPPTVSSDLGEALRELGICIASPAMQIAADSIAMAAPTESAVLITGETGTGKELFAKLLHRLSPRWQREMVAINSAAIPGELVESYLFGHAKGSFTGAHKDQKGKFEHADGSTLFLDEIGDLPAAAQAKLLRVLNDGIVEPVGKHGGRKVDVRIVAATNHDLQREVEEKRFRADLYYRLNVIPVRIPPLRERRNEIPALAAALLRKLNQRAPVERRLSKEALRRLEMHDWPGNVRELSSTLEHAIVMCANEVLGPADLRIEGHKTSRDVFAALPEPAEGFALEGFLAEIRTRMIRKALEATKGNQSAAAGLLGLSKQAVNQFLKDNGG